MEFGCAVYFVCSQLWSVIESFDGSRGRDRLARLSVARTSPTNVFRESQPHYRCHLGRVAYSSTALCRLQCGNESLVCSGLLECHSVVGKFHSRLAQVEIGQPLAGRSASCKS